MFSPLVLKINVVNRDGNSDPKTENTRIVLYTDIKLMYWNNCLMYNIYILHMGNVTPHTAVKFNVRIPTKILFLNLNI